MMKKLYSLGFLCFLLFSCLTSSYQQNNDHDEISLQKDDSGGLSGESLSEETESPVPEPSPSPFDQSLAISQVINYPLDQLNLVKNRNQYLYIIQDLNNDKLPELIFLGFESDDHKKYDLNELKDFSLLYQEKGVSFRYYLMIFSSHISGEYELVSQIDLGKWIVFKSIRDFSLSPHKKEPFVISVVFQTKEGSVEEWMIFYGNSFIPRSQLHLEETLFQRFSVDDLDQDGLLDVIVQERLMEEGVGYETILTWKKWNGKRIDDYRSTNIVRNLNEFFKKAKAFLINDQIAGFLNLVLESSVIKKYRIQGLSDIEIMAQLFKLPFYDSETEDRPVFIDIVFPEIRDNPFTIKTDAGWKTKLVFRIVYSYLGSYFQEILEVDLKMNRNPFVEQQYSFLPVASE